MKITLTELREIISEEMSNIIESIDSSNKLYAQFQKDIKGDVKISPVSSLDDSEQAIDIECAGGIWTLSFRKKKSLPYEKEL
jgi:hypothetical protein